MGVQDPWLLCAPGALKDYEFFSAGAYCSIHTFEPFYADGSYLWISELLYADGSYLWISVPELLSAVRSE